MSLTPEIIEQYFIIDAIPRQALFANNILKYCIEMLKKKKDLLLILTVSASLNLCQQTLRWPFKVYQTFNYQDH